MNEVEKAVQLIGQILASQKLTVEEHKQVQSAFALILKTRKRPKLSGSEDINNGDASVQLQATD